MEALTSHINVLQCEACNKDHDAVLFQSVEGEHFFMCPDSHFKVVITEVEDTSRSETLNEQRIQSMASSYRELEDRVIALEVFIDASNNPSMRN